MFAVITEPFEYYGKPIELGIIEIDSAKFESMRLWGNIRPATSIEISEHHKSQKTQKPRVKQQ